MNEMVRPRSLAILLLLVVSCVSIPDECDGVGLENNLRFDEEGFPIVSKVLIVYYPECANALAEDSGLDGFHAATFEERRRYFGPEWEEVFREEACVNRSWAGRPPSICRS